MTNIKRFLFTVSLLMLFFHQQATAVIAFSNNKLKNDLTGDFEAQITYAQALTIPQTKRVSGDVQTKLVMGRDTLLMVQPLKKVVNPLFAPYLTLKVFDKNNNLLKHVNLHSPDKFPHHDGPANSKVKYYKDAWSIILPKEIIKPKIRFELNYSGEMGYLNNIVVGAPNQVLINTIDLGLLTSPQNKFNFAKHTYLHADYYQKIPVRELLVNTYEPIHLKEVVSVSGETWTKYAPGKCGWYSGVMRQQIAKVLISKGINSANYGINSSIGNSESTPNYGLQVTAHNARGRYESGYCTHGLSGGGGVATISGSGSTGNEWSHELGHNYGLGHYPGGINGSIHNISSKRNSAWGWHSTRNRFITNFSWKHSGKAWCCNGSVNPWNNHRFMRDAMAGGFAASPLSRYTLYTPYTMKFIQNTLENRAIFTPESATGFKKWHKTHLELKDYSLRKIISNHHYSGQSALNTIRNDTNGKLIRQKLTQVKRVSISVRDGGWLRHIYIPTAKNIPDDKYISVHRHSAWNTNIHINGKNFTLGKGKSKYYKSKNEQWIEIRGITGEPLIPRLKGVKVATIIGFYDPQKRNRSFIYPALYGAWGYVYPEDKDIDEAKDCLLRVHSEKFGEYRNHKLHQLRYSSSSNKFHVNVEQAFSPSSAEIFCQDEMLHSREFKAPIGKTKFTINGVIQATENYQITNPKDELEIDENGHLALDNQFVENKVIELTPTDEDGINSIKLPKNANEGQQLIFSRTGNQAISINLGEFTSIPTKDEKAIYTYKNGRWQTNAGIDIDNRNVMRKLASQHDYLRDLLTNYGHLRITTSLLHWVTTFSLQNGNIPDNATIKFTRQSGPNINIVLDNTIQIQPNLRETVLFTYKDTSWQTHSGIHITDPAEIADLENNPTKLAELINAHNKVTVTITDNSWIETLSLPETVNTASRFVLKQHAKQQVNLNVGDGFIIPISRWKKAEYLFQDPQWVTTSGITIRDKENIDKIDNDAENLATLLNKFNTVNVILGNNSSLSKIVLPDNAQEGQKFSFIRYSWKATKIEYGKNLSVKTAWWRKVEFIFTQGEWQKK